MNKKFSLHIQTSRHTKPVLLVLIRSVCVHVQGGVITNSLCIQGGDADTHCRQFSVIRPYLTNDQCHPEDGALEMVSEDTWRQHMNVRGQIEDDFHLRKVILVCLISPTCLFRTFT